MPGHRHQNPPWRPSKPQVQIRKEPTTSSVFAFAVVSAETYPVPPTQTARARGNTIDNGPLHRSLRDEDALRTGLEQQTVRHQTQQGEAQQRWRLVQQQTSMLTIIPPDQTSQTLPGHDWLRFLPLFSRFPGSLEERGPQGIRPQISW
ncbi:hypothetical protein CC78DRAFT_579564 [Lojkania enalia]|uniref:Uncharacterized protein n=1 Tax=Lojkania enalia TaxID=147567 RepID=A0A9P4KCI6_9PLEO|nr:hypothetical protein CC78DRAFT_579564 [Didymosphaeria enalia]